MNKKILFAALLAAALSVGTGAAGFNKTGTYTQGQFTDVPGTEWYAGEVAGAYELGLMNGVGGGLFSPDGNVTVAEAITMASRASAIYAGETIDTTASGEWYTPYVNYAAAKGIIKADAFDNYDRAATRSEVAVIFKNALPAEWFTAKNDVKSIPDVPEKSAYAADLLTLYKAGVVMGSDSYGNFFPENNITRAEAAAIVNRVALPESRLAKTLDKISDDDAYSLILTSALTHGTEGLASGWKLDNRGGLPRTTLKEPYGALFDVDDTAPTALIRDFNKTSTGVITLYTKASIGGEDGIYLAFRNEAGKDVYRLQTEGKAWNALKADGSYEKLVDFTADDSIFEFEIIVDIDNARSTTYINGKDCGTRPLAITEKVDLASFRWGTTEKAKATLSPTRVNAYANYTLLEGFDYAAAGTLPRSWSGNAVSDGKQLIVEKDQSAAAVFNPVSGKIAAEFEVWQPKGESVRYALRSGAKDIVVFTSDDKNFYVNGTTVYENYYKNQWYRMRFELDTETQNILVKLNGRKIADVAFGASTTSVDNLTVSNSSDTHVAFDAFKVFRLIDHDDYVPEPVVPKGTDKYTVGMNVCSLWQNGTGSTGGWNCISAYKDVEPVLGYYDEGLPETADWEIKYTLEHGIDFQAFCVFFTHGWGTDPQHVGATHLYDGYMNAKYSDMSKFAIIWEAANAPSPGHMENWKESFVPYLIENYFKDPRYITADNRPILCVFGPGSLSDRIGGDAKVKEMFDYLEEEVKKLGFNGMVYLACGSGSDRLAAMGFDGCYAYNWGTNGYLLETNKESMLGSANTKGIYTVPTVSVGLNNMPWAKVRYPMMTMSDYAAAQKWVKEDYIPSHATEKWQEGLVMLSTWNEYGEGTYIMPTTDEKGFGYLDALREAYTDEKADASINTVPTANQAYRINHLYPQNLHLLRRQGYYVEKVDETNLVPIYTFDLATRKDYALWGVENSSVTEEGVFGTSTNDTIIIFPDVSGEKINLDNVAAIRVTAKIPKGLNPCIYYTTTDDQNFGENKRIGYPASETDDWAEYTVAVSSIKKFKGTLCGFRFDPAKVSGKPVAVKKIEFLGAEGGNFSNKLHINGVATETYFAPQKAENGDVLLPFDPESGIDFQLNTYFEWDQDKAQLTLYFTNHTVVYTVGSDTYTLDGASKKLPYKFSDIDGLPLLPIKTLCEEVGYTFKLNDKNEIDIETPQKHYFEADTKDRVYGQWEFNTLADTENWKSSFMNLFVNNGYMSCETMAATTDPTIVYSDTLKLQASDYESFELRIRYQYNAAKPHTLKMYFGTNVSGGHNEAKTLQVALKSTDSNGEWETYKVNLADVAEWKDVITSLRFDPFDATGRMDIDYMRFVPKQGITPGPADTSASKDDKPDDAGDATVYEEPDIPTEDKELGTLIWYNNFEATDAKHATYAAQGIKFDSNGVSGNVSVVDNPDTAKGGKALKVTPTGAHGGYAVNFPKLLQEPGTYTFMVDIYMPNGNKIDPWIRFETKDADGNSSDPNFWEGEKQVKNTDGWYTWSVTMSVTSSQMIGDYSVRTASAEEYYIDNVRIYRMDD